MRTLTWFLNVAAGDETHRRTQFSGGIVTARLLGLYVVPEREYNGVENEFFIGIGDYINGAYAEDPHFYYENKFHWMDGGFRGLMWDENTVPNVLGVYRLTFCLTGPIRVNSFTIFAQFSDAVE